MGKVHGANVVIGIPTFGMLSSYFMQARASQQFPLVSSAIDCMPKGLPIAEARNQVVEFALAQNANYIYWLDDDVIAPSDAFLKLWRHQKDIINGVYWSKSNPPMPLLFRGHLSGPYLNWHCLLPDEKVQTDSGMVPISKISANNKVLSHTGNYRAINKIFRRNYEGKAYEILPKKLRMPVRITSGHPVRVVTNVWKTDKKLGASRVYNRDGFEYVWKNIEDINKRDMGVVYPINRQVISVEGVNKERARLFGYFLSEGSLTGKLAGQIDFSFGYSQKELDYVDDVQTILKNEYGLNSTVRTTPSRSTQVRVWSKDLATFLDDNFGRGAHSKRIPHWAVTLPKDQQLELIKGMVWGDGNLRSYQGKTRGVRYTTISESMTTNLVQILLRFNTIPTVAKESRSNKIKQREGNKEYEVMRIYFNQQEISDVLGWEVPPPTKQVGIIDGDNAILPIEYIKEFNYTGDVYNLEVDVDNSYVTKSFAVHNCGDLIEIDAAGNGLTLVKTDVYRKIRDELGGPWYSTEYGSFPGVRESPYNNTEDLYFYWKARKVGYKVWADTSVQAHHYDKTNDVLYSMPAYSPQSHPAYEIKPNDPNKLIADIGSGPISPYIDNGKVVSFDIREDVKPDVICDVRHLPTPNNTFDIVHASHVLEHFAWRGVDKVLKEWTRVLKVGGELRLVVPNLRYSSKRIFEDTIHVSDLQVLYGGQEYPKNFHACGFTPNVLRSLVESLGVYEDIELKEGDINGPPNADSWNLQLKAKKVRDFVLDNITPEDLEPGPQMMQSVPMRLYDETTERPMSEEEVDQDLEWFDSLETQSSKTS